MIGIAALLAVAAGALAAHASMRWPSHAAVLETGAGLLVIGALALAGYALPRMI